MAKFAVGKYVYVPSRLLPSPEKRDFALTRAKVQEQKARSVRLDIQDDVGNDIEIATKALHGDNLGITMLRIGDLSPSEDHALDPLAKSTLHYLRLLLEPDAVRLREVRCSVEVQAVWREFETRTSHVVIIGHGRSDSIRLLDCTQPVGGKDFGDMLSDWSPTTSSKIFVSLTCLTGRAAFARPFSESKVCSDYLAPFQSVHSAAASLFAQSFFANHLLAGKGVVSAYGHANRAVVAGVNFKLWRNGEQFVKKSLSVEGGGS